MPERGTGVKRKLILLYFLCLLTIITARPSAAASVNVASAPLKNVASARNGMVRVWLSSLGSPTKLTVTVRGSYTVEGRNDIALKTGQKLSVAFNAQTGSITLTVNGKQTDMGREMILRRHQTTGTNGLLIAETKQNTQIYPGDLRLVAQKNGDSWRMYPIVNVYMESYLYGVLPYEMGASAPIEALKAQAVSARTYTLRRMNERASKSYDVVDTTNDQVYYGTPASSSQCVSAVDATKGIVLTYGGKLINAYYSSSNGGQTESAKNYWGTQEAYLPVKDDPFDLMSTSAVVKTMKIPKDFAASSQNKALSELLSQKAGKKTIAGITGVSLTAPRYPEPSRLYTKCEISVKYTNGGKATFTFDIFKELETVLNLSINTTQNELWSVEEETECFLLKARRYGHGIGMSQMGAMQMGRLGYSYDKILGFYYPGAERSRYTMTQSILSSVGKSESSVILTEEEPAVITETNNGDGLIDPDEYAALAAGMALVSVPDRTTLNMRNKASKSGKILCRIPHGSAVKIKTRGATWCQVEWNGRLGHVMTKFLTFPDSTDSQNQDQTETSGPQEEQSAGGTAKVIGGTLNLRQAESKKAKLLGKMKSGSIVQVTVWGKEWSSVIFQQKSGYAMTQYLEAQTPVKEKAVVRAEEPGENADPAEAVRAEAQPGSPEDSGAAKPEDAENSEKSGTVRPDEAENTEKTGTTKKQDSDPTAKPEEQEMEEVDLMGTINTDSEGISLRASCSEQAEEIMLLKPGTLVHVSGFSEEWSHIQVDQADGYCLKEYVLCN